MRLANDRAFLDRLHNPAFICRHQELIYRNPAARRLCAFAGAEHAIQRAVTQYSVESSNPVVQIQTAGLTYDLTRYPLDDEGEFLCLLDATLHRSEQKYLLHESQLERVLDSLSDGVYITDDKGVTLAVNATYETLFDTKNEEVVGKDVGSLVKKGMFSRSVVLPVLKNKQSVTRLVSTRNNKEALVTGNPIFDESGKLVMVVTNVRDISDLNSLQQELQRERALSDAIMRSKIGAAPVGVVAKSPAMLEVLSYAEKIAPFPTSILLTGETGVGKEVVAGHIHRYSSRADQPFLEINCSAIPESLLESELFGYTGGAFTGASRTGKPGLLELADNGTLLLDEIGDMPISLQAKLLRFLQDGTVLRVGGTKPKKVDVRIISATNVDLASNSNEGKFRKDLYYRINVLSIKIPPLRERTDDIEALAEYYLEIYCKNYGLQKLFSPEVMRAFKLYPWPGNVRELKNIVENLVVSTPGNVINSSYLPQGFLMDVDGEVLRCEGHTLQQATCEVERTIIMKALYDAGGLRKAARQLGMNHSTLYRRIKRLHIDADQIIREKQRAND